MNTEAESTQISLTSQRDIESGRYLTAEYTVFPGISIVYYNSHTQSGTLKEKGVDTGDVFEIFHCREGRMECSIGNDFCYISPGDLLIVKPEHLSSSLTFPLQHYHGITIRINISQAPKCFSCFLQDVAVQPKVIKEKFCGKKVIISPVPIHRSSIYSQSCIAFRMKYGRDIQKLRYWN